MSNRKVYKMSGRISGISNIEEILEMMRRKERRDKLKMEMLRDGGE